MTRGSEMAYCRIEGTYSRCTLGLSRFDAMTVVWSGTCIPWVQIFDSKTSKQILVVHARETTYCPTGPMQLCSPYLLQTANQFNRFFLDSVKKVTASYFQGFWRFQSIRIICRLLCICRGATIKLVISNLLRTWQRCDLLQIVWIQWSVFCLSRKRLPKNVLCFRWPLKSPNNSNSTIHASPGLQTIHFLTKASLCHLLFYLLKAPG